MQPYLILAAATDGTAQANYPYLLGLAAVAISLVALFRVSAIQKQSARTPAPQPQPQPSQPAAAPQAAAPAQPVSSEIPPEIVAVIAAAVAAMTGGNHRILSIKPMSTSWERAGRQSVLTSHRIR